MKSDRVPNLVLLKKTFPEELFLRSSLSDTARTAGYRKISTDMHALASSTEIEQEEVLCGAL